MKQKIINDFNSFLFIVLLWQRKCTFPVEQKCSIYILFNQLHINPNFFFSRTYIEQQMWLEFLTEILWERLSFLCFFIFFRLKCKVIRYSFDCIVTNCHNIYSAIFFTAPSLFFLLKDYMPVWREKTLWQCIKAVLVIHVI